MTSDRLTIAGAYQRLAAHEDLCAERYRGINEKLSWILGGLATVVLALLAWALVQLYALEPLRASPPTSAAGRGAIAACLARSASPLKIDRGRWPGRIVVTASQG